MMEKAEQAAEKAGYQVWGTGGGCLAFARRLRSAPAGEDEATLDLMITTGEGTSIDGDPEAPVWEAGVCFTDPRGGETLDSRDGLTLPEAIAHGKKLAARTDKFWSANYDPDATSPSLGR